VGAFEPQTTAALRTEVKRIELAAERLQQETLERLVPSTSMGTPCSEAAACARTHLAHYGERLGGLAAAPTERILAQLAALDGASVPR
jgi:hypothetical protein